MGFQEVVWRLWTWYDSEQRHVAGCLESGNKPSGVKKCVKFLDIFDILKTSVLARQFLFLLS